METIEQLKQENDKLNARLAKAVEVFKEQKAQIEALQKYKDFDSVSHKDYDEVIEENNTLKNKISELEHDADCFNGLQENNDKKYQELKELYDDSINAGVELGKEIAELNAKIHQLETNSISKESYDEKVEDISNLLMQVAKFEKDNSDLVQSLEKYKSAYAEAKEKAEMWQKNLHAVENTTNEEVKKVTVARDEWIEKYRKLEAQYKEQEKFETEVINVKVPQLEERLKEVENVCVNKDKEIESKNLFIKQLQTTYDEVFAEFQELKEINSKNINAYNDLKEKFDKLNILYINLENEKLTYEANIKSLQRKYDESIIQDENNVILVNQLTDTLQNILEQCDNILNPKLIANNKSVNKNNKVKDSTGNQFMTDAAGMNI